MNIASSKTTHPPRLGLRLIAAAGLCLLGSAGVASAGFTPTQERLDELFAAQDSGPVFQPAPAMFTGLGDINTAEGDPDSIFSELFNADAEPVDNFKSGDYIIPDAGVYLERIEDARDPQWGLGAYTVRAVAKFSDNEQTVSASDFGQLFTVSGSGFDVNGIANVPPPTGDDISEAFNFERTGGESPEQSSIPGDNVGERDHLLTWQVLGLDENDNPVETGSTRRWLLFWEDLDLTADLPEGRTASDYNDLVLEVLATDGGPGIFGTGVRSAGSGGGGAGGGGGGGATPIPLPPAFYPMAGALLMSLFFIKRR
ncbi:MAG: hypothetical protein AAGK78_07360 [Planctomycetota bacterium]